MTVAALAAALLGGGTAALAGSGNDDGVHRLVERLRWVDADDDEQPARAFLGVMTERTREGGARIRGVVGDSAAERAGLERGDVIVRFDGRPIDDPGDLIEAVLDQEPGERVEIEVLRDGQARELDVELGERKSLVGGLRREHLDELREGLEDLRHSLPQRWEFRFEGRPRLGVELIHPTPELREHFGAPSDRGVIVGKVLPGTPAEAAGLRVGDLVVAIDGREVRGSGDLIEALAEVEDGTVTLEVVRDGRTIRIDATLPEERELRGVGPRA